jgi:arylsulfatase A-like enzyme
MTPLAAPLARQTVAPEARSSPDPPPRLSASPWDHLAIAACFGAVTGLVELALVGARFKLLQQVTFDLLRKNHHFLWMIPASNILIFTTAGLFICIVAMVRPKEAFPVLIWVLGYLATLALVYFIPRLYPAVYLLLAAGLNCRVFTWIAPHARRLPGLARTSLPFLAAALVALVALDYLLVTRRESRLVAALPPADPGAPNVALIVLDTVRADHLSVYGYARDTTPHLARLAERGVRFERAHAPAPWTLPSHASLFTGRWPHELSLKTCRALDTSYPTLAGFLSQHGYASAGFVANTQNTNAWYGMDRGFAHYQDFYRNTEITLIETVLSSTLGRHLADWESARSLVQLIRGKQPYTARKNAAMINHDALAWLTAQASRPWFLFLNYYDAHDPYDPPAGTEPRFHRPATDGRPMAEARNRYDNCLAYLDLELGRFFAELDRRGLLANTLVMITADHGEGFGAHHHVGHGGSLYETELHVPLLVLFPGRVPAGQVVSRPVSVRDLPATMADLVGLKRTSPFPGPSLAALWEQPGKAPIPVDEPFLAEVDRAAYIGADSQNLPAAKGPMWAIFDSSHVYIRNSNGFDELYNLRDDPFELYDLSGKPEAAATRAQLHSLLDRMLKASPPRS